MKFVSFQTQCTTKYHTLTSVPLKCHTISSLINIKYCLGLDPLSSCYLLKFNHLRILIDCGLELGSLLNFTPSSLKEGGNAEHKKDILSCFKDIGGAVYVDSTAKLHLPQLSLVDMSSVDALIVTNCYNMLALPYITEYTNFKGKIYATEPTIQLGRYHF